MIKKPYFFFILITATISAQQDVSSAFVEKWDNSKNYLLDIAKAMPEEHYGFKPTDREMTFKEQLFHIIENMDWLSLTYFTTDKHKKKDRTKIATKQQVLEEIRLAFDTAKNRIQSNPNADLSQKADFFAGPKSKLQIMNLMQDHVTHHRGQIIVYLNMNQIQPPKYVGW